jgi:hypothetical protein
VPAPEIRGFLLASAFTGHEWGTLRVDD